MAPTILFKGEDPYLMLGAPGGSNIPMGILQVILNAVDFGMSVVEAVNDIQAIKQVLGEHPQAGKYVGIPLRSLRVREVGTETQVKVVIQ